MSTDQTPNLFTTNNYGGFEPALARTSDPITSHRAAARQVARGTLNSGAAIILSILSRCGRPLTYREIWQAATDAERAKMREASTVAKRLPILQPRGLVLAGPERICTVGKTEASEWELAGA
jgi:hypothetical protein